MSAETRINAYTLSRQSEPQGAVLADGSYVIVWSGAGLADLGYGIWLQRFTAAGERIGGEVLVNTTTLYSQRGPAVVALSSGGYAVTWDNTVPGGQAGDPAALGVFVQSFDAGGGPLGAQTRVSGSGYAQDLAALPDGGYIVSWTQLVDTFFSGVMTQRFDANARVQGPPTVLDQDIDASLASIAVTPSGSIAVWRAYNPSGATIAVQTFDQGGARTGATLHLPRDSESTNPEIVRLAGGGFALVWFQAEGLYALILKDDGRPSGDRILVQSAAAGSSLLHSVVATPDGGFAIAWERFSGTVPGAVAVAAFSADGSRNGPTVTVRDSIQVPGEPPGLLVLPSGDLIVTYARYVGDVTNFYDVFQVRLTSITPPIEGTAGPDVLNGTQGNDTLIGGRGADALAGGAGADRYVYRNPNESDTAGYDNLYDFETGVDSIDLTAVAPTALSIIRQDGSSLVFASTAGGPMLITASGRAINANDITYGGTFGVYLVGSAAGDTLVGSTRGDGIIGHAGNDVITGGGGGDALGGGAGSDIFRYLAASDSGAAGYDNLFDFETGLDRIDLTSLTLSAISVLRQDGSSFVFMGTAGGAMQLVAAGRDINGADFTYTGAFGIHLVGSVGSDTLVGSSRNDTVIGGGAADTLHGGAGADVFRYVAASDSTVANPDRIQDFVSGTDKVDLTGIRTGAADAYGIAYSGGGSFLFVDLGGDGTNDMLIQFNAVALTASDLIWTAQTAALEDGGGKGIGASVLPVEALTSDDRAFDAGSRLGLDSVMVLEPVHGAYDAWV